VISGPSGAGKGTLIRRVLLHTPALVLSVSATTRPRRKGEVDGRDYHFLTRKQFDERIRAGEFLEWAEYAGYLYGTPRHAVMAELAGGRDVILEIELEGAREVLEQCPEALMMFIMPPSIAELERRLLGRKTESARSLQRRLARAREEMALVQEGVWLAPRQFDYVILNDTVDRASDELAAIIKRTKEEDEQAHRR
jgi:guanylate kinase